MSMRIRYVDMHNAKKFVTYITSAQRLGNSSYATLRSPPKCQAIPSTLPVLGRFNNDEGRVFRTYNPDIMAVSIGRIKYILGAKKPLIILYGSIYWGINTPPSIIPKSDLVI